MLQQIAPWFGYAASLCLILALLVKTEWNFRFFSIGGNIFFMVYALLLHAVPVFITNVILLCINIFYLSKLFKKEENFDLIEFQGQEKMVEKFFEYHQQDIQAYFPHFNTEQLSGNLNFAVLRDLVIANIFSASVTPAGDANVDINYTLQKYRDFKVGTFIFEKEKKYLLQKGVKRIVYQNVTNKKHANFLKVMGFSSHPGQPQKMMKELSI